MDTDTIQRQITAFVENTVKRMKVDRIILYGSALHNPAQAHDIDLIVVGDFPTDDPESFLYDSYTHIPRTIDFHVCGVPAHEKITSPFIKSVLEEGKLIYITK